MQTRDYFINGEAYFDLNQYTNAIEMFNNAIFPDNNETNTTIYLKRGIAYLKKQQYENAVMDFEKLRAYSEGKFQYVHIPLGELYEYQADQSKEQEDKIILYAKAAESYQEVADRLFAANIKFNKLYEKLQKLQFDANKICFPNGIHLIASNTWVMSSDNLQIHNKKVQENVKNYKYLNYLYNGDVYYHYANYKKSIEMYDQSIKLQSTVEAYYNRGRAYFHLKKYKAAVKDFNIVIEEDPTNVNAFLLRSVCYNRYLKSLQNSFFFQVEAEWIQVINDLAMAVNLEPNLIKAKEGLHHFFSITPKDELDFYKLSLIACDQLLAYYPNDETIAANVKLVKDYKTTATTSHSATKYKTLGFLTNNKKSDKQRILTTHENHTVSLSSP